MRENYFTNRKSCRLFKREDIDLQIIKDIIEKASKAPTCGNMQLYSILVTHEEERLKKLAEFHYNQPASQAPVILTICADFNRFTRWCDINKAKAGYDNFHSFISAMTDAVIFAQQIATIAEMEGYGTCYLGTVTYNAKEISEFLDLPELVVPVVSLAIGVPAEEGEDTKRLPLEGILHIETYRKDSDEKIQEIFKVHDQDPENEKYLKENKKDNLSQVFAEVRYPKDVNEYISKTFMSLLKEKGFVK